ncbi:MAG: glycosyltransferase family 2 protein [Sandaracinaceae bacterium]
MKKANKLRTSPARFFADSRVPGLRRLAPLAQRVARVPLIADLLEQPVHALAERELPLVSRLARSSRRRAQRERSRLLAKHGHPTVSVIVAAHNAEASLAASLDSLLAQSHHALEVLVVDDRSTDRTVEVANRAAARDRRVRVLQHDANRGAAIARNTGLAAATGDYLSFQDADDRSHPERIERQLASLLSAPGAALAVCNFRREAPDGTPLTVNGRRFAKNLISMLFSRAAFERVGYLRPLTTGEDAEYYERIKAAHGQGCEVHRFETLYFARFEPSSLLFSNGEVRREGDAVFFTESPEHRVRRERALDHLEAVRAGRVSPYVPFE